MEVLVAGDLVCPGGGASGRQAEDRAAEVSYTRLEQEQSQPARDELQAGQKGRLTCTVLQRQQRETKSLKENSGVNQSMA